MNRFGHAVRSIEAAASTNGASRLMSTALRNIRPGLSVTVLITPASSAAKPSSDGEAGAMLDQAVEIIREALAEPQVVAHVGFFEVERLDAGRADALHVPGVKELVRDGAENARRCCGLRNAPELVSDVLLRCSMPSPLAHGR